jgi:hypothetical protein
MRIKQNIAPKRKISKRLVKPSHKKVSLVHTKNSVLRHFRLIEHKLTGKLIHHRHTSHLALAIMLLFVGFFLYVNDAVVRAETRSGYISIGVTVSGHIPTIGATIISPVGGLELSNQHLLTVSGTCEKGAFVVVSDNNFLAGSTVCTDTGVFSLEIHLSAGENTLTALNYDNLNQPGPATPRVTIYMSQTGGETLDISTTLPINPSLIPGVQSTISNCSDYKSDSVTIGGEPHIAVVCIPRLFSINTLQTMGILVWGGSPPYALSIDMGDQQEDILISLPTQGYRIISFSYASSGNYKIELRLKDKDGKTAVVQTSTQVNGEIFNPITNITNDIFNKSWFETPVPFYLLAVSITLGFWGGDIFDRKFGASKLRGRTRKTA